MTPSEQSASRVPLGAAVLALDERKQAATPDREPEVDVDSDVARFMVLGFDLDVRELIKLGQHVGRYTAKRLPRPDQAAEAAWADGVLTGLMLAELRSRRS